MKLFLIIVGAVVTGFAFCLLLLVLWLRRLTRRISNSVENQLDDLTEKLRASIPPPRIKLFKLEAIDWRQGEKVQAIIETLQQAGFGEVGSFRVEPTKLLLEALCNPAESAFAIVYENRKSGVWFDLVTRYLDGTKVTYTSLRDTLLDRAESNVIRFYEGAPAEELLRRFRAERPSKPMRPVSPDDFVEFFEQAHADSVDWRMARGGPTEAEIRRQAERRGEECSPLAVKAIRDAWAITIDEFYQRQCRENFLADSREAERWKAISDRLVFVHDRIVSHRLESLCEGDFGEESDSDISSALAGAGSLREAFARWNAVQTNGRKYEKIGEVSQPVVADIYLPPEQE